MRLELKLRGRVWWVYGSNRGEKIRKSTGQTVESKARRLRDKWEREFLDPAHFRADQATLASAAERWMKEVHATMNPETARFYDSKIRHVVRVLGRERLSKFVSRGHERVLEYIEQREGEGAHQHSIHRELTALRLSLRSAKRAGEYPGDPRDAIPRYQTGYVPQRQWVTDAVVWAAIGQLLPHRGAAVAWCLATACDFSSITTAHRDDVQPTRVRVRGTKTGTRDRWVPRIKIMEPFLTHALKHGAKEGLLFGDWGKMARDVRKACRRAGVPEFTARTLRRSAATWLVTAGVPYEIAAKFLGHGNTTMLQKVYGQMAPEDAARLINERTQ